MTRARITLFPPLFPRTVAKPQRQARPRRQPADPPRHGAPLGGADGVAPPRPRRPGARPPASTASSCGRRSSRSACSPRSSSACRCCSPPSPASTTCACSACRVAWLAVAVLPYAGLVGRSRSSSCAAPSGSSSARRRGAAVIGSAILVVVAVTLLIGARGVAAMRSTSDFLVASRRISPDAQRRGGVGGVPVGGVVPRRRRARASRTASARCGTRSGSPRATSRCSRSSPRRCAAPAR